MAVHARLGGWNIRKRRVFDRGVAVTAVDAQSADVMLMAERHRLLDRNFGARSVGGCVQLRPRPNQEGDDEDAAKNAQTRKSIRAVVENLGHLAMSRGFPAYSKRSHLNERNDTHQQLATVSLII
jgi:hypothetical protein